MLTPSRTASPDTWAWSLDTVLSATGIGVAVLGAVATVLVAALALEQTKRANRLEDEARARVGRAEFARAVEAYLTTVPPFNRLPQSVTIPAMQALHAAAAGVGSDAEGIPGWLHSAILNAEGRDAADRKGLPPQGRSTHTPQEMVAFVIEIEIRGRITRWVASGHLDRSPLLR
ncbi:hypothetical protein [Microbacterium sp.]|uniref:hypothetical protein n=1 Tax=Microbacterium sp. TaxID=51671 RepID=UPI0039E58C5E